MEYGAFPIKYLLGNSLFPSLIIKIINYQNDHILLATKECLLPHAIRKTPDEVRVLHDHYSQILLVLLAVLHVAVFLEAPFVTALYVAAPAAVRVDEAEFAAVHAFEAALAAVLVDEAADPANEAALAVVLVVEVAVLVSHQYYFELLLKRSCD